MSTERSNLTEYPDNLLASDQETVIMAYIKRTDFLSKYS